MKDKKWRYFSPVFESEQYNPEMLKYSPWTGHKRFAYDYVRFMEPSQIVELGSYYGCSAFSFLQAVKDGKIKSDFYGVDTWAGDDYTQTDYKEDIYGAYKAVNDKCFSEVESHMLRMTFDEALCEFEDKSIDLLHIDGSHSYEDVKHDWMTWQNKVKDNGVVFFHDVGEDLLFGEKMGSHIFWEELKEEMPYTLEFKFSNGLGILFKREEEYLLVKKSADFGVYQSYINLQDTINKDELRKGFFKLRDLEKFNEELKFQINNVNEHLDKYATDTRAKQVYIEQLENDKKSVEQDFDKLKAFTEEKVVYVSDLEKQINQLKDFTAEKDRYLTELESQMEQLKSFADEKDRYSAELESQMKELADFSKVKEDYAENLKSEMEELKNFSDDKDRYAKLLEKQLADLKEFSEKKTSYADELEKQMTALNDFATGKDEYASELENRLSELNKASEEREKSFKVLQQYASETEDNLNREINKLLKEVENMKNVYAALYEEKSKLEADMNQIKERCKRVPFGSHLLKGIE